MTLASKIDSLKFNSIIDLMKNSSSLFPNHTAFTNLNTQLSYKKIDEYSEKLQAALDARSDKNFIIVARTDARATEGLDKAIERGLYYKKVGADVIFVEAPKTIQEMN